jgi:hypothetical protein
VREVVLLRDVEAGGAAGVELLGDRVGAVKEGFEEVGLL